jgi:hypothetical protein
MKGIWSGGGMDKRSQWTALVRIGEEDRALEPGSCGALFAIDISYAALQAHGIVNVALH